jgi:hypothetical protein
MNTYPKNKKFKLPQCFPNYFETQIFNNFHNLHQLTLIISTSNPQDHIPNNFDRNFLHLKLRPSGINKIFTQSSHSAFHTRLFTSIAK